MKATDFRIRDPFIVAEKQEQTYYLFGTTDYNVWSGKATGFDVYKSKDLVEWEGPFEAFRPDKDFWADKNFWAPEVHKYNGAYYMFASFKADGVHRGTQILKADNITGSYETYTDGPVTPCDMECLDGTLYVDDDNKPWIIFSQEWTQVHDGRICVARLSEDLKEIIGEIKILFSASQSGWAENVTDGVENPPIRYVTDGPFIFKRNDKLYMLWSSFYNNNYSMGLAYSKNNKIDGEWIHEETPFFKKDGGHGMIFETFEGKKMLTIHAPNKSPNEHVSFINIDKLFK